MKKESLQVTDHKAKAELDSAATHPRAFHVYGPRHVSSPNWKDLFISSWKDANYKRTVMACFIQGVYLLELDRQEKRTSENALAPNWWTPFKYKLTDTLIDERDGSIFGAILEWNCAAALADYIVKRPNGAPRAVLALRGTLLKASTITRDIVDDLRFLAWESLSGSVRFSRSLNVLRSIAAKYGGSNICLVGYSLGAGFALQVGKTLAKEGIYVEAHLFNPPSVSLAMSLRNVEETAGMIWNRFKAMIPSSTQTPVITETPGQSTIREKLWVPHLYVNNSDYVCCYYIDSVDTKDIKDAKDSTRPTNGMVGAKLYVSKGKQNFLEAHGLQQWWSNDLELQTAISNSKLISQQLKSLYSVRACQPIPNKVK